MRIETNTPKRVMDFMRLLSLSISFLVYTTIRPAGQLGVWIAMLGFIVTAQPVGAEEPPVVDVLEPFIITEIMYDAAGSDTDHEWIELLYQGTTNTTLVTGRSNQAWRIFDRSAHTLEDTDPPQIIPPQSLLILASDPETFRLAYPTHTGVIFKSAISLANSAGQIRLSSDGGSTWFHERSYEETFGAAGNGKTLEWIEDGWHESSAVGGTPGVLTTMVPLPRSETPAPKPIPSESPSPSLSPPPTSSPSPTPSVSPAPSPTPSSTPAPSPSPTPSPSVAPPNVVISEFMYDLPGSDTGGEWLEILNRGSGAAVIRDGRIKQSWRVDDGDPHILTLVAGTASIESGGFGIIARDPDRFRLTYPSYTGSLWKSSISLPNSDGNVAISADGGLTWLDRVIYRKDLGAAGNGKTLELTAEGWQESIVTGGTPGGPPVILAPAPPVGVSPGSDAAVQPPGTPGSSSATPTEILPPPAELRLTELLYDAPGSDTGQEWLEFQNIGLLPVTISPGPGKKSWRLRIGEQNHILEIQHGSATIKPGEFFLVLHKKAVAMATIPILGSVLTASFSLANTEGKVSLVDALDRQVASFGYQKEMGAVGDGRSLVRTADGSWRPSQYPGGSPGQENPVYEPPQIPKLLITEISPAPLPGQEEWIELWNPTSDPVDLTGWLLDDQLHGASRPYLIPSGQLLPNQYRIFPKNETLLSLHNTSDEVHLIHPEGGVVASQFYRDGVDGQTWAYAQEHEQWAWSDEGSPGAATPERSLPLVLLKDQTILVTDEQSNLVVLVDQTQAQPYQPTLPAGSHVALEAEVAESFAKSALVVVPEVIESVKIIFSIPTGTKPSISAGDTIEIRGYLERDDETHLVIVRVIDPETVTVTPQVTITTRPIRRPRPTRARPQTPLRPAVRPVSGQHFLSLPNLARPGPIDLLGELRSLPRVPSWTPTSQWAMLLGILGLMIIFRRGPHGKTTGSVGQQPDRHEAFR